MSYEKDFSTRETPQTERTSGREDEVQGRAGGYVFAVDDWTALDRFLILGSEAPTYYASARELTVENCTKALHLIEADGLRVVERVREISTEGRAPSNDPALFVLAMASSEGDLATRRAAFNVLPEVARIATHLFHFLEYRKAFGGWGRLMKAGVASWYLNQAVDNLAYQAVKYRQRDGWTHRDALRKAHPKTDDEDRNRLFKWIVDSDKSPDLDGAPKVILGYELLKSATNPKLVASTVSEYNLPREAVPTEFLNSPAVWEALLYSGKHGMPITAMLRNLGNMSKIGLLAPFSGATAAVVRNLTDREVLRRARVHPYALMLALKTYGTGQSFRGSGEWDPVSAVVDALEAAMDMSFDLVEPTGKRILIGLDVSGSMGTAMNNSNVTAREAATLMALVTAKTESTYQIMAFSNEFMPLDLTRRDSFRGAMGKVRNLPFMGTDCALPMLYAMGQKPVGGSGIYGRVRGSYERFTENVIPVDAFIIYTDNETWVGNVKPFQALQEYRRRSGISDAKLVVVGITSNGFTIADPTDGGMLDVVGFDTAAPAIIADFIR
jgi:60 kDa SS-A/Ro ribonucleoprotein